MFSSLASFLFGSNTNCETNSETSDTATATAISEQQRDTRINLVDVENFIEVTSLTPSVTGALDRRQIVIKRGRNKRNSARQQKNRDGTKAPLPLKTKQTNIENRDEEEFDEDDWFIVEREVEEQDIFPTRSDSEGENVPVTEAVNAIKSVNAKHINSHSLYSEPRLQKQRNLLQKTRPGNGLSVSTLSPSRAVNDGCNGSGHGATDDGGLTRSMYVAPTVSQQTDEQAVIATNSEESINKMEESWFVTPPPCFTSTGPIIMETSPYENLLIEHPSMSVYYSIKRAQEAAERFVNIDSGVTDMAEKQTSNETTPKKNSQAVQPRASGPGYRLDRETMAQLKQQLLARNIQKVKAKNEYQNICRTAIKRTNKARDVESKNHTKRRSDRQHSKIFSYASNNRKTNCC